MFHADLVDVVFVRRRVAPDNEIGAAGGCALADALPETQLTTLDLGSTSIRTEILKCLVLTLRSLQAIFWGSMGHVPLQLC